MRHLIWIPLLGIVFFYIYTSPSYKYWKSLGILAVLLGMYQGIIFGIIFFYFIILFI